MRDPVEEASLFKNHGKASTVATPAVPGKQPDLVQGVYVVAKDENRLRVRFVPITTGITGTTDIEVLSGLKQDDEIVTGHYKVLRTLRSGIAVKRDNSITPVTVTDDSSS